MASFNGRSMLLDKQPITSVFTDSCTLGAGAIYNGDWFYANWQLDWPAVANLHINSKEILAVFFAVCRWAPAWSNKRIYIQSDNITSVATINRGTSKDPFVMSCLRTLFWLSAKYNFHITSKYIPGLINTVADKISRAHEPGSFCQFLPYVIPSDLSLHMSQTSLSFLFGRFCSQGEGDDRIGSRSCRIESAHIC